MERAKFLVSNVSKEVAFAMGDDYIHSSSPLGTGKFFVRYVPLEAAKVSIPMMAVTDSSESSSVSDSKVGGKFAVAVSESVEAGEAGDKVADEATTSVESDKEEDNAPDSPAEVGSVEVGSADEDGEGDDSDDKEMPVLKFFYHPYDREFWSSNYVKLFTPPKSSRWLERLDKKSLR